MGLSRARCIGRSPLIIHSYVEYMLRLLHTPLQRDRARRNALIFTPDRLREVSKTVAFTSRGLAMRRRIRAILDIGTWSLGGIRNHVPIACNHAYASAYVHHLFYPVGSSEKRLLLCLGSSHLLVSCWSVQRYRLSLAKACWSRRHSMAVTTKRRSFISRKAISSNTGLPIPSMAYPWIRPFFALR